MKTGLKWGSTGSHFSVTLHRLIFVAFAYLISAKEHKSAQSGWENNRFESKKVIFSQYSPKVVVKIISVSSLYRLNHFRSSHLRLWIRNWLKTKKLIQGLETQNYPQQRLTYPNLIWFLYVILCNTMEKCYCKELSLQWRFTWQHATLWHH